MPKECFDITTPFGETIFSVISPLYAVNWHMTISFLSILPDGFQRIFIWVMFISFGSWPPWNAGIITVFLSEMGYQRLSNIRKLVHDSTGCPVRTKTKKNLRCGKSSLEKWNSLLEVSQSVVEARLKLRDWLPDLLSYHTAIYCAWWMPDTVPGMWQALREYAFLTTIGNHALRQRGQTYWEEMWPFQGHQLALLPWYHIATTGRNYKVIYFDCCSHGFVWWRSI